MPLPKAEWDRLVTPNAADKLALRTLMDALPAHWPTMSPHELMSGAAVLAMRYDRHRMAETVRTRVIFSEHPDLLPDLHKFTEEVKEAFLWMAGRVEATVLGLADQIESGMSG